MSSQALEARVGAVEKSVADIDHVDHGETVFSSVGMDPDGNVTVPLPNSATAAENAVAENAVAAAAKKDDVCDGDDSYSGYSSYEYKSPVEDDSTEAAEEESVDDNLTEVVQDDKKPASVDCKGGKKGTGKSTNDGGRKAETLVAESTVPDSKKANPTAGPAKVAAAKKGRDGDDDPETGGVVLAEQITLDGNVKNDQPPKKKPKIGKKAESN